MNLKLFLIINGWAGHSAFLDSVMVFCAHWLIYAMVAAVVLYAIVDYRRWHIMVLSGLGSAVVARFVVASGIRYLYVHARPAVNAIPTLHLLLPPDTASSFPSGHTIFAFALAAVVYLYNKKVGLWFYVAAALIGFSRIYVGLHWPYDVAGGIVLGILTGIICDKIFRRYKHLIGL